MKIGAFLFNLFRGWIIAAESFEAFTIYYTAKEVPQPHVLLALGLLKVKPLLFRPPCQSISIPYK